MMGWTPKDGKRLKYVFTEMEIISKRLYVIENLLEELLEAVKKK